MEITLIPTHRNDVYRIDTDRAFRSLEAAAVAVERHIRDHWPCPMKTYRATRYVVRVLSGRKSKALYTQILLT